MCWEVGAENCRVLLTQNLKPRIGCASSISVLLLWHPRAGQLTCMWPPVWTRVVFFCLTCTCTNHAGRGCVCTPTHAARTVHIEPHGALFPHLTEQEPCNCGVHGIPAFFCQRSVYAFTAAADEVCESSFSAHHLKVDWLRQDTCAVFILRDDEWTLILPHNSHFASLNPTCVLKLLLITGRFSQAMRGMREPFQAGDAQLTGQGSGHTRTWSWVAMQGGLLQICEMP